VQYCNPLGCDVGAFINHLTLYGKTFMLDEGDDPLADKSCQRQDQFGGAFVKGLRFVYNDARL